MAKPHGSVRIGPISLFTLIIVLCLAVLTVLSVTTSLAELSTTERQAATTTETYQLESEMCIRDRFWPARCGRGRPIRFTWALLVNSSISTIARPS